MLPWVAMAMGSAVSGWLAEWMTSHSESGMWLSCVCAHTGDPLGLASNCGIATLFFYSAVAGCLHKQLVVVGCSADVAVAMELRTLNAHTC